MNLNKMNQVLRLRGMPTKITIWNGKILKEPKGLGILFLANQGINYKKLKLIHQNSKVIFWLISKDIAITNITSWNSTNRKRSILKIQGLKLLNLVILVIIHNLLLQILANTKPSLRSLSGGI